MQIARSRASARVNARRRIGIVSAAATVAGGGRNRARRVHLLCSDSDLLRHRNRPVMQKRFPCSVA